MQVETLTAITRPTTTSPRRLPIPPWSSMEDVNNTQEDIDDDPLDYPHPLPPYPPLINIQPSSEETKPLRPSRRRSSRSTRSRSIRSIRSQLSQRSQQQRRRSNSRSSTTSLVAVDEDKRSIHHSHHGHNYLSKFLKLFTSAASLSDADGSCTSRKGEYEYSCITSQNNTHNNHNNFGKESSISSQLPYPDPDPAVDATPPHLDGISGNNNNTSNSNSNSNNNNNHHLVDESNHSSTNPTTNKKATQKKRRRRRFLRKSKSHSSNRRKKTSSVLTLGTIELSLLDDEDVSDTEDYKEYAHPPELDNDDDDDDVEEGEEGNGHHRPNHILSLSNNANDASASLVDQNDEDDLYSSHYIFYSHDNATRGGDGREEGLESSARIEHEDDGCVGMDHTPVSDSTTKPSASENDKSVCAMDGIEEGEEDTSTDSEKNRHDGDGNDAIVAKGSSTSLPCHDNIDNIDSIDTANDKTTESSMMASTKVEVSKDSIDTVDDQMQRKRTDSEQTTKTSNSEKPKKSNVTPLAVNHVQGQIMSLHKAGRMFYSRGYHEDAWNVQNQALKLMSYLSSLDPDCIHNNEAGMRMNYAKLKYDVARTNLALLKRQTHKSESCDTDADNAEESIPLDAKITEETETHNSFHDFDSISIMTTQEEIPSCQRAFQSMVNARHRYWIESIAYYEQELSRYCRENEDHDLELFIEAQHELISGNQDDDQDDTNQSFASESLFSLPIQPTKPTDQTCHILYILHTLGRLYDENLSQYRNALKYYKCALKVENDVLSYLHDIKLQQQEQLLSPLVKGSALKRQNKEIRQWKLRVRNTKRKIGSIYYLNGRFDLALTSSFAN